MLVKELADACKVFKLPNNSKGRSHPRTGMHKSFLKYYLEQKGWEYVSCVGYRTGFQVHLDPAELPKGRIIVSLSRHYAAVIVGVLHDTYDSSRGGKRGVYGYWRERQV